jgi:hypothetical protein
MILIEVSKVIDVAIGGFEDMAERCFGGDDLCCIGSSCVSDVW